MLLQDFRQLGTQWVEQFAEQAVRIWNTKYCYFFSFYFLHPLYLSLSLFQFLSLAQMWVMRVKLIFSFSFSFWKYYVWGGFWVREWERKKKRPRGGKRGRERERGNAINVGKIIIFTKILLENFDAFFFIWEM